MALEIIPKLTPFLTPTQIAYLLTEWLITISHYCWPFMSLDILCSTLFFPLSIILISFLIFISKWTTTTTKRLGREGKWMDRTLTRLNTSHIVKQFYFFCCCLFVYLTYISQEKAWCYPLPLNAWQDLQRQPCSSYLYNTWDLLEKLRKRLMEF